ncbi:hypothetical protein OG497_37780 [Streptomyces sp. NBC_01242]|uniref:hypothetical protein n=1 Tax=Streptomyces sp. NBC_01242 TaxID=2903795 RepID=UPI00225B7C8E|nr:hypothetical protein [Streptomyces sp. NBC_01242]MCX4799609.1 hypothetical protein [Streptomyces sp. NBC_01242]
MPTRLPEFSELRFVEAASTGTVHFTVYVPSWLEPEGESVPLADGTGRALAALLEAPTVVRCGRRTFPNSPSSDAAHQFTDCFDDERLCGGCYRTLHEDDQALAFEHRQPGERSENCKA